MTSIEAIEGIGETYGTTLGEAGIETTEQLLEACATPKGRSDLAEKTGISGTLILEWANRADLFRVKGVQEEYSDLLEAAGVDTVAELARRNPENLHQALADANAEKNLVRQLPSLSQVKVWVEDAKQLPRVLEY